MQTSFSNKDNNQLWITVITDTTPRGLIGIVLASSVVDRVFEAGKLKPKNLKLDLAAPPLNTQYKGESARNQDIVSEWGNMYIRVLV